MLEFWICKASNFSKSFAQIRLNKNLFEFLLSNYYAECSATWGNIVLLWENDEKWTKKIKEKMSDYFLKIVEIFRFVEESGTYFTFPSIN